MPRFSLGVDDRVNPQQLNGALPQFCAGCTIARPHCFVVRLSPPQLRASQKQVSDNISVPVLALIHKAVVYLQ